MGGISNLPFDQIDPELQAIMKEYNDELGG